MIPGYLSFKVDIKNLKFTSDSGRVFPKTAILSFVIPGKMKPVVELLGYIDEDQVFEWIDHKEALVLDQCYISKFSLSDYRSSRALEKKEYVELRGFSAKKAFFDSQFMLDFSYAHFTEGEVNLEAAWFNSGKLSFESARFTNRLINFSYTHLPAEFFNFKNVEVSEASISFKNAVFGDGEKDFQYTRFGNGDVNFTNTEFGNGDVSFINSEYGKGNVSFKVARFGKGKVDFHFARFEAGDISFERTEFGDGRVDFRTVEFGHGKVNFNRAVFGDGEVSFEACEMNSGKFSFKRAQFGKGVKSFDEVVFRDIDVSFERTDFGEGTISFYKSTFGSLSFRFCHLDNYTDLRLLHCDTLDMSNTIVRDIIDLKPHEFNLDVRIISFAGMRLIGRLYIDWKQNHVKEMVSKQEDVSHRIKAEQYRILKENFNTTGQYSDEDAAYVEFKRHEECADLEDQTRDCKWAKLWAYPLHWFKVGLFDKAGLYATSPVRVLLTMAFFFISFSIIYFLLITFTSADIIPSVNDQLSVISKSFYHSAITFLTIGYGDHYPYGSIRWVSALEGFSGLFLMSYFTVAFVRKILR